ncbi:MAG: type II toxin-antitoxin system death-on-curing family toxin [Gammaproteobacteria bacterium]|nr:type II toxin-antitoxin system death-on-curing family toxin [Gammaproteobacteria bacterium]MDE0367239.1 type II toxin-antitoxin system death-on-curing family toxin [Gammaproteobacteria bacterium]
MARSQIVVLSEEEIFNIHELVLQRDGGLPGLRMGASLSATVERIYNHAHFDPDYRDPWRLSALWAYAIAVGHPFNDANKRTALTASVAMLKCNAGSQPEPAALAEQLVAAAARKVGQEEFIGRFESLAKERRSA